MERAVLPHPDTDARHPDTEARRIRVLVVDDNAGFRESLLSLLDAGNLAVIGEADSGIRALDLVAELQPDVVLMDVRMPEMDGIEATRLLKERYPSLGVVALSGHEDQEIVREMLVAGASGYVLKDSDGDDILNAVLKAAEGGAILSPGVTPRVIEDLTEALERERRRTRELEAAQEALVERAARRHDLVARLSHELRTPVTVILGVAQTLAKGHVSSEQGKDLLERLIARSQDLSRLVARFEVTIDAALTERVDIAEVARQVAEGEPRMTVDAEGWIPRAHLNRAVARRVVEELVDNALRFSPHGSPVEVRVSLGDGAIEVRVSDRGSGISDHERERIFGPLEQLEDLNIRVHQGAGMGLALARTAARAMDGDVQLEVSGAEGSTFLWTIALEVD
jgi:DNA-binding NarL/FixJ family response regulator/anti-sigma regulatory factor (Ser/Thr protein kinase)